MVNYYVILCRNIINSRINNRSAISKSIYYPRIDFLMKSSTLFNSLNFTSIHKSVENREMFVFYRLQKVNKAMMRMKSVSGVYKGQF